MKDNKRGSAGGKAYAIIQKQKAKDRIDEYNKHPNLCLCCGKPIIAPYDKRLNDTKRKKFCNLSCSAKYNNIGVVRNKKGKNKSLCLIDTKTDEEIINCFNESNNFKEFCLKLGYKSRCNINNKSICDRLKLLNLDINDLILKQEAISSLTKKDLFTKRSNWQNARSTIQKNHARITYQESDKPKECVVCKYSKHFEVAHIKAVSEFNDDSLISEINNIDNLIALCPNHHWEYDNTDFDIKDYL